MNKSVGGPRQTPRGVEPVASVQKGPGALALFVIIANSAFGLIAGWLYWPKGSSPR